VCTFQFSVPVDGVVLFCRWLVCDDDGYMLSEICRRYDNGPLVYLTNVLKYLNESFKRLKHCGETRTTVLILCTSRNKKCYENDARHKYGQNEIL
jgi:hypothetical protein